MNVRLCVWLYVLGCVCGCMRLLVPSCAYLYVCVCAARIVRCIVLPGIAMLLGDW
jgi:hypothetical protein